MSTRIALLAAVIALIASAAVAGPALAAKGGNQSSGGGKGHHGTPPATCMVTPNPVPLGAAMTISGSGFPANAAGGYSITGSGGTAMGFLVTDATGSFSLPGRGGKLGTYTVYVSVGRASATCTFVVV